MFRGDNMPDENVVEDKQNQETNQTNEQSDSGTQESTQKATQDIKDTNDAVLKETKEGDDVKKSLDEIRSMMENLLKDIKNREKESEDVNKTSQVVESKQTDTTQETEETVPTGEKIELDFGKNRYIIQTPSDWDDVMKAKLRVLIDEAEKTGKTLLLDKALKIIEIPKNKESG